MHTQAETVEVIVIEDTAAGQEKTTIRAGKDTMTVTLTMIHAANAGTSLETMQHRFVGWVSSHLQLSPCF